MVRNASHADERPTDLKFTKAPPTDWFPLDNPPENPVQRAGALPVHPDTSKCVHARLLSVHAVIAVVPGSGEIRIPYLRRKEQGEFALFMDALVTEIGEDKPVRFTNVFMSDDEAAEAYDRLERYLDRVAPDMNDVDRGDKVRLEDALDGFEHELEVWGPDTRDDPVDTLVGQWDPHRERNSDHG